MARRTPAHHVFAQLSKHSNGFDNAHSGQGFNGFNADKLIVQNLVCAAGNFHELRNCGKLLSKPMWSTIIGTTSGWDSPAARKR